jgi:O-antigen ligase
MAKAKLLKEPLNGVEKLFPWIGALIVVIAIPVSDDPVNIWKFLALITSAGILTGLMLIPEYRKYLGIKEIRIVVTIFVLSMLIPLLLSGAPLLQQLYGISGRLTGFFSLASFSLIFLIASSGLAIKSYKKMLLGVVFAGTYNLILSVFENLGIEPLKFDNTYKVPLGSLGNPNFMSAFLAIFTVVSMVLALDASLSKKLRSFIILQIPLALFELTKVGSKQGFYVVAAGFAIVSYLLVRAKLSRILRLFSLVAFTGVGALVAAGFLNVGPLAGFVFKNTAQFRYEYWMAGLRMAKAHLVTGVGLNSYGDWFREYRSLNSITSPGKDVSTNVSHNVYIDYLATGGLLHFLAYLTISILVLVNVRKYLKSSKSFDPIFTALFAGWASYQLQALISVDNLAIAIWAWIFGGSIIGYVKVTQTDSALEPQVKNVNNLSKVKGRIASVDNSGKGIVFGFVGFLIMALIAIPVVNASIAWRSALLSRQVENIVKVGKQWPDDEIRLVKAVGLLINNQQNKIALDLAVGQISKYPRSVPLRYYIIQNPEASEELKAKMKSENQVLDPFNPDWK